MKKLLAFITVLGLALNLGGGASVLLSDSGNEWDDVPNIYLPVRR